MSLGSEANLHVRVGVVSLRGLTPGESTSSQVCIVVLIIGMFLLPDCPQDLRTTEDVPVMF